MEEETDLCVDDLRNKVTTIASELVAEARKVGCTFGCAESCTGGLVSGAITSVPGASEVFLGSVVSYAIAVKRAVLGVEDSIFEDERLGAVSSECAEQMCAGAARVLGADVAVSVTGIAGPGGAEPGKPVGTVWFGVCSRTSSRTEVHHFAGSRELVRLQAVITACQLIREAIVELSSSN